MTADHSPLPGETTAGRHRRTLLERFWAKVNKTDTCWLWTGAKGSRGYGTIWLDGKSPRVHRVSYELFVGPIPEGLQIDHLCRTPLCVNPEHLEPVTGWVNYMRGISPSSVNARKTHCAKGHPYAESGLNGPGRRRCSPCALAANRAWKARQPKRGNYLAQIEECKHGHPFDEANTIRRASGSRGCRACQRIRSRESYERKLLRAAGVSGRAA